MRHLFYPNLFTQVFKWTSIASFLWIPALFLTNKSLWVDELLLALNFVDHDWKHLLSPLDHRQMAPIGFLLASKCLAIIFNNQDFAFKVIPALAWIGSWFLFKKILIQFKLSPIIIWGTMAAFSSNYLLLSYAYEFKQYCSDVFFSLLIFSNYLHTRHEKAYVPWFKYGLVLFTSILFSNVSIVVMTGLAIIDFIEKGRSFFKSFFFKTLVIQAILFGLYFFTFLYKHPTEGYMLQYRGSKNAFFPSPTVASFILHKTQITFSVVFNNKYIGLFFLAASGYCIYINRKIALFKTQNIGIIILTIHVALGVIKKYPFENRFILYLIPFILLSIAYLFNESNKIFQNEKKKSQLFNASVIVLFLSITVLGQLKNFRELLLPKEDVRSLIIELDKHAATIDHIYVSEGAEVGFLYYRNFYPNTFGITYSFAKNTNSNLLFSENHKNIALIFSHYSPFDNKESLFEKEVFLKADSSLYNLELICKSERSKFFLAKKRSQRTQRTQ